MTEEKRNDDWCFACGEKNPIGLGLDFSPADGTAADGAVEAIFTPEEEHQGYSNVVHGGLISTVLDEAMAQVLRFQGVPAYTARIEVRFRSRLLVGERCRVRAWKEGSRKSLCRLQAELVKIDPEETVAVGKGSFMIKSVKDGNNEKRRGAGSDWRTREK